MKPFFLLTVVLACSSLMPRLVFGQSKISLYLKNGSKINGQFINVDDQGSVKLLLYERDTLTITSSLIKRYDINGLAHQESKFEMKDMYFRTKPSFLVNESGLGYSIKQSWHKKLTPRLFIGPAIALQNFENNADRNLINLGLETRFYLTNYKISPFAELGIGKGIYNFKEDQFLFRSELGYYANPTVGLSFNKQVSFDVYFGLMVQRSQFFYAYSDEDSQDINRINKRLEIGIGIGF
jgi:hypothetical protein